jgi:hypothetical protein
MNKDFLNRVEKDVYDLYWLQDGTKIPIRDMDTDHIINCLASVKRRGKTKIYHITQGNTKFAQVLHALELELDRRGIVVHPHGFAI